MTTANTKLPATETYAGAYLRLSAIAEKLKTNSGATTIDHLVDDVRDARAAYAVCRERLDAVRREIDTEITAAQAEPAAAASL